jgi:hypothetical protein
VFQIMAGMLTIGGIVFIIFGSADVQPWAMPPVQKRKVGLELAKSESSITIVNNDELSDVNKSTEETCVTSHTQNGECRAERRKSLIA